MQYDVIPVHNPDNFSKYHIARDGEEVRLYRFITTVEYATSITEKRGAEPKYVLLQRLRHEPSTNTNVDDDQFPPVEWCIDYFKEKFISLEDYANGK